MKKYIPIILLSIVCFLGSEKYSEARPRPITALPNVFLDVQVSSNALPGARVTGSVTALGVTQNTSGTTNNLGQVSLPYFISSSTAAPTIPASFTVRGVGTDGINVIQGTALGNFTVIPSSPTVLRIPVILILR